MVTPSSDKLDDASNQARHLDRSGAYELIDFGNGRKLESLAGYVIDRPSPPAEDSKRADPSSWKNADARFDLATKRWRFSTEWPQRLSIRCGRFQMPVSPTPFGHIGLFPEQQSKWDWLSRCLLYTSDAADENRDV